MKNRFSTLDIIAIINELQKCIGMRVNQIYDIDNKTYLIRMNRYEEKTILLLESGVRLHTTEYEWPKNPSPSGFSMKMRKHLKNKRLEKLNQLGMDRIVDLQFGINEAAYHIILELYDRGNIVLTDFEYTILNILRPRTTESEDVKFVVREKYPVDKALSSTETFNCDGLYFTLKQAKEGDSLKKLLLPQVAFGPALLDHVLIKNGFPKNCAINKQFKVPNDMHRLFLCLEEADVLLKHISLKSQGYIIQRVEKNKDSQDIITNVEFHPYLFHQFSEMKFTTYDTFDKAVDNFFSSLEGQKIDIKALQKEKEALKKLENVKKDHDQRLSKLQQNQSEDMKKALLIEMNSALVEKAITVIRSAIANQMSWSDIEELIKEAQSEGDPIAKTIKKLKLNINHFTLLLSSPLSDSDEADELKPQLVDIDLGCSAYANARKYYDMKRAHAKKEQKTLESSEKAFKSAEKKTKQTLKEVAVTTSITKARKVMWFEKFLWFISSENYLVIGGRDVQQNELLVKRYMKASDLYVHADLHGASSVIIKNPLGGEVPPKTLNEAGTMAACYSSGWDAKIVTSAWWVYSHQVSKTAPSGEYLTTGSFMIRGKKNYLAPANLIMGFGFMFKLDEESILQHTNERCEKSDDLNTADEGKGKDVDINVETVSDDIEGMNDEDSNSDASHSDDDHKFVEQIASSTNHMDVVIEKTADLEVETTKNSVETDEEDSSSKSDLQRSESVSDDNKTDEDDKSEVDVENNKINEDNSIRNNSNSVIIAFPDTEVKFDVLHKNQDLTKKTAAKTSSTGVIVQEHKKKAHKAQNVHFNLENSASKEKCNQQKRGQKGKLKKIKEKYKDQDEEERRLRMSILASAGSAKEDKKNKNKKSKNLKSVSSLLKVNKSATKAVNFNETLKEQTPIIAEEKAPPESEESCPVTLSSAPPQKSDDKMNEASDEEMEDDTQVSDELKLLNSLTGCPHADDTLLFAIPVCAPYTCMLNYKYKVKIIPGSHRRGKAAKTALNVFLSDKTATSREKDLLKCVKDQDISRNLPGKIKISAGNIKKSK